MLPRPSTWRSETACPAASARSPDSSRHSRLIIERTRATRPLRSARVTGRPHYYETVRPPAPHRYSGPHTFRCLGFSLSPASPTPSQRHRGEAFPRSALAPEPGSRHLHAGHHQGSKQVSPWLLPGQQLDPGSGVAATLSTRQQWFTHVRLPGSHLTHFMRLFRHAHHHGSFTAAADGGLESLPAERIRRAIPPSPVQHRDYPVRSSTSQPPVAFAAHRRQRRGSSGSLTRISPGGAARPPAIPGTDAAGAPSRRSGLVRHSV